MPGQRLGAHVGDGGAAETELAQSPVEGAAGVGGGAGSPAARCAAHCATVLLVLGVPERTTMGITGWSAPAMAARYQHVTDLILRTAADQVGGLLWADEGTSRDCK